MIHEKGRIYPLFLFLIVENLIVTHVAIKFLQKDLNLSTLFIIYQIFILGG
jgi:hypothetical protein